MTAREIKGETELREMMRLRRKKTPENDFFSVNIREYLALGNDEEAEVPALVELLSGFPYPKNPDMNVF